MDPKKFYHDSQTSDIIRELHEIYHGLRILCIFLTGSRGKKTNSDDSDYDLRVLTICDQNTYLLQKCPTKPIKLQSIIVNGFQIEGQYCDILHAINMVNIGNSLYIREILSAPYIYFDPNAEDIFNYISKIYLHYLDKNNVIYSLHRQFDTYLPQKLQIDIENKEQICSAKYLTEIIYLILFCRQCIQNQHYILYYDINDLIEKFAYNDVELFNDIICSRRKNSRNEKIKYPINLQKKIEKEIEHIKNVAPKKNKLLQSIFVDDGYKLFLQLIATCSSTSLIN